MKNASFRQKLLTSFLAIGILPLLICTLLMLNHLPPFADPQRGGRRRDAA